MFMQTLKNETTMTTLMKTLILRAVSVAALSLVLMACGSKQEHAAHDEVAEDEAVSDSANTSSPEHTVDAAFQQQLSGVFDNYVGLKDAFVASDPAKVKQTATSTLSALENVDMALLTGVAHHDWMTYLEGMQTALKQIEASSDIEAQRQSFASVTDALYKSIKSFGLSGKTAYYEFCPMAFNDKGGYWLSNEKQIRNPYFGDKMLTCGSVVETL